jgi:TRAP transporter TAXI family solute receptor
MRKTRYTLTIVAGLLLLPFALHWGYLAATSLPSQVTIATGPKGGAYRELAESLARDLRETHGVNVSLVHTSGSSENVQLLSEAKVDFALAMAVPSERHEEKTPGTRSGVAFVANAYSEVVHLVVRNDIQVETISDLRSKRVALGENQSANYLMARVILGHCGLQEPDFEPVFCSYPQMCDRLRDGTIDAAILVAGVRAPMHRQIAASQQCRVLSIPYAPALSAQYMLLTEVQIPAGRYQSAPSPVPMIDVKTVAARAQLLTRHDVASNLVKAVTAILLNAGFQQQNELTELSQSGRQFAQDFPQFEVHPGVQEFYSPEFRPLLNPDFVEATEGLRSFVVSLLIAIYLGYRWLQDRRERKDEHQLDGYFRALVKIESRQIDIDSNASIEETEALEKMLDEVTLLRQEALKDFSAHELKDDRAADCFLEMCHAISEKIGAKLLRQQLAHGFVELRSYVDNTQPPDQENLP